MSLLNRDVVNPVLSVTADQEVVKPLHRDVLGFRRDLDGLGLEAAEILEQDRILAERLFQR